MSLNDLSPDWKFVVYPKSAIPQRKIDAFIVTDIAADLIQGAPSDWGGVFVRGGAGNSGGNDWARIGANLTISGAGFARFLPNGRVERFPQATNRGAFGGFFVLPTLRPQSCIVDGQGTVVSGTPAMAWRTLEGTWETSPGLAGRGTGVLSKGTDGANNVIQTQNNLAQNGGFEVGFNFLSQNTGGTTYLQFGPDIRLAVVQGNPPRIERRTQQVSGNTQITKWTPWRRLQEREAFDPRGEQVRFAVQQIGGRMVCSWGDKETWLLDENAQQNQDNTVGKRARGGIPQWGNVPLRLEAKGQRVRAEIGTYDHLNDAGTAPRVATITRRVPLTAAGTYAPRMIKPIGTGFVPVGGDITVSATHDDTGVTLTTTITSDSAGLQSPTCQQMLLSHSPVWVNGSGAGVDCSGAVTSARVTLSAPPDSAGSEGSVSVDLKLAAKLCPAALPLLQDFAPFEVSARWRNDRTGQPVSDYRGLMQGFLLGTDGSQSGYNRLEGQWTLRDPIVRLQAPAGIIDGNFPDLLVAYQQVTDERIGKYLKDLKAGTDPDAYVNPFTPKDYIPVSIGDFTGADAVKFLLGIQLGPGATSTFNGNGNPTRFLRADHPPLLNRFDMQGSVSALSLAYGQTLGIGSLSGDDKAGFFPPPFGDDLLSWISKIKRDDRCDFWTGHTDRDTDIWPVFIYGQYEVYLDQAYGWRLDTRDAANIAGAIEDAKAQSRPESAINRVLVWASPFGVEIPLQPAFIQGEAMVAYGPDAPFNSWARTLVLRESFANWATTPAQAAQLAAQVLQDIVGTASLYPRYQTRGNAQWLVGDVFFAHGLDLNTNDLYVRASKIEHEYKNDPSAGKWWTTTVSTQPMTNSQIQRFHRNNALRSVILA